MSQTNYIPSISIQSFGVNYGPYGAGSGSPEGVAIGYPGYLYTDVDGPDLYAFAGTAGTSTGWAQQDTGGGGGGANFTHGTGSPEGGTTATVGTTYFDTAAVSLWMKKTGSGNTGWVQLIA